MELRLGEKQTLVIVKKVEFGVYLATKEAPEDKVLLPAKQVRKEQRSEMNWKYSCTGIPVTV